MIKESSIYIGNVIHKRFKPKIHFFKYKVFSILLDLSEINLLDKSLKIFSSDIEFDVFLKGVVALNT